MKKILFMQLKGNSIGGIWFVDKALGENFLKQGFDVRVLALRNNAANVKIETDLKIDVINKKDRWFVKTKKDVIKDLLKFNFKTLYDYILNKKIIKKEFLKMKEYVNNYDPDYIITTQYHMLKGIPKKYLSKTINVQHSSFDYLLMDRNNIKTFKYYENKIYKLCWLSKSTLNSALKFGYKNSCYIYNPNRFSTKKIADVVNNKKITVITRIHEEKRIDLMIQIVNNIFKKKEFKDWSFDIYGIGEFNEESNEILKNQTSRIRYMGLTDNPKKVLLGSSINLNTSIFEGFSLSIIEAFSCGIPTVTFDFGEAVNEQIIDGYNGYIINQGDINEYQKKLESLMRDKKKLQEFSVNSKKFSEKFEINNIAKKWIEHFRKIEENNE